MEEHVVLIRFSASSEFEAWRIAQHIKNLLYPVEREHGLDYSEVRRTAALVPSQDGESRRVA